jgi:hypothetical protein
MQTYCVVLSSDSAVLYEANKRMVLSKKLKIKDAVGLLSVADDTPNRERKCSPTVKQATRITRSRSTVGFVLWSSLQQERLDRETARLAMKSQ